MNVMGALKAAMLPIAGILLVVLVSSLSGLVINLIPCYLMTIGPTIVLSGCSLVILVVLFGLIGFYSKKSGFIMEDSAAVGAIIGLVAGLIQTIVMLIMPILGLLLGITANNDTSGIFGAGFFGGLGFLCVIPSFAIIGAVLAVVGYFIAQEMK